MADHVWSIFCHKASIDSLSRQMSLLDVIEQITTDGQLPSPEVVAAGAVFTFHGEVVSLWRRSRPEASEAARCRVSLVAPDGATVGSAELPVDLSTSGRVRTILRMEALPYRGEGEYAFVVSKRDDDASDFIEVARIPYELKIKGSDEADAAES